MICTQQSTFPTSPFLPTDYIPRSTSSINDVLVHEGSPGNLSLPVSVIEERVEGECDEFEVVRTLQKATTRRAGKSITESRWKRIVRIAVEEAGNKGQTWSDPTNLLVSIFSFRCTSYYLTRIKFISSSADLPRGMPKILRDKRLSEMVELAVEDVYKHNEPIPQRALN